VRPCKKWVIKVVLFFPRRFSKLEDQILNMIIKVKFHLPSTLTGINKKELSIELKREISLKELLDLLGGEHPDFARNFLSSLDSKKVKVPFLILVNNKSVRLEDPIKSGDNIEIFPSVAGG
jgi:molybdopterin converting factor small subunit